MAATTQELSQASSKDENEDDTSKNQQDGDDAMFEDEEASFDDEDEEGDLLYGDGKLDPVLRDCMGDEEEALEMDALNRLPVMSAMLTGRRAIKIPFQSNVYHFVFVYLSFTSY